MPHRESKRSAHQTQTSRQIAHMIARGEELEAYEGLWKAYVTDLATNGTTDDPMAMVQWVLREAYQESTDALKDYADKVAFYNDLKRRLREQTQELRSICQTIEDQIVIWEQKVSAVDPHSALKSSKN